MKGVKKARRKFQSQLPAVEMAPCLARVRVGNVSPMRIQIPLEDRTCKYGLHAHRRGEGDIRGPSHGVAEDEHARADDHHYSEIVLAIKRKEI